MATKLISTSTQSVFISLPGSESDLQPVSDFSLVFSNSVTLLPVDITIRRDQRLETNEEFNARLSALVADPDITIRPAEANITILDDDGESLTLNSLFL